MSDFLEKDVVIVGGGPAGLSAALVLGRGRKRVLLCDAGTPRNARAEHMQGFVTRDGLPPSEFRAIGREQLRPYDVDLRDVRVASIQRAGARFHVTLADGVKVEARRVLLATGLVDEIPDVPGYRELWGHAVFQCPYCHGWEVRDRAWGVLANADASLYVDFALFLKGWSSNITLYTQGGFQLSAEQRERLVRAEVRIVEGRVRRLVLSADAKALEAVELEDGARVAQDVLVVHPAQRQVSLVKDLGLALDELGFVKVDASLETSLPGVFAAGDLTTRLQGALVSAAAGAQAAYRMNHLLNMEAVGAGPAK
ncbi:pyridine nucleotide-disulfide oxidoreductase domain-containing protein [Myxococcus stipitatus DSM 14675]|uniref:Pyridine nucleotide-disulfide oxidoreductase domain-containing protein n=1 Tax=Myxococcus stipitatus (strain DSM 14675 / JCM 12634 / Mx s8) TaxID=1278073 RepID=L7UN12_MYXSD|nr:NAD(P)/FAD-dependent oxidoreductase [Myxococcus stipitatus]AGC49290.1 pyridine nucleotide-disulfide oxidoreductase domain-containing protein [Myxococcus stipitatus DSM 14675]